MMARTKTSSQCSKVKTSTCWLDRLDQQDPDDQPVVQPPAVPSPDPQGNPNQLDDVDDDEEASLAHMLPPNLGDDDLDDDDPDDDDDDKLWTSTGDSSDQSEADSMEDEEAEQHDDGSNPIELQKQTKEPLSRSLLSTS
jgi:hypothetical protein